MIYFGFNITNPWSQRWANVWSRAYELPIKHKFIELEVIKDTSLASFSFKLATRTDHSGLYMDLGLLGYSFSFNFYDGRHWNEEAGRYYIYDTAGNSH
jgi:hypothetical protein